MGDSDAASPAVPPPHDAEPTAAPAATAHGRRRGEHLTVFGIVVAVLLAALVGVALTTEPAPSEQQFAGQLEEAIQGCERGNWPREVFGRPQGLTENPGAGVYLWLDFEGWHLRAAGGLSVTGEVFVTGLSIQPGGESSDVDVQPNALSFTLDGLDPTAGLDFAVDCEFFVITFDVRGDDGPVPIDQIFVGQQAGVAANPFLYQREDPR